VGLPNYKFDEERGCGVEWLDPWWDAAAERPDLAAAYERQLVVELGPGHPLYGVPLAALGKHDGSDDVLFRLLDGSGRVAVIHLTWARWQEEPPWPGFSLFPNLEAFAAKRMRLDNEEFTAE
jgi:hypothetical protein